MAFGLNLDTEVFAEAFEAHIGPVLIFVVLGMWELGETVLGNILGAYDAWFARNRDSLARFGFFFGVLAVIFALAFDANWSRCFGWSLEVIAVGIGCHDCSFVHRSELGLMWEVGWSRMGRYTITCKLWLEREHVTVNSFAHTVHKQSHVNDWVSLTCSLSQLNTSQ